MVQHVESVRDVQLNNYVGVWTLDFGGVIPGSEGSELSAAYMEERILAQWEAPSWRPAVRKTFSYVDVKI